MSTPREEFEAALSEHISPEHLHYPYGWTPSCPACMREKADYERTKAGESVQEEFEAVLEEAFWPNDPHGDKLRALYAAALERAEQAERERDDAVNYMNRPENALLRDVASLRAERDEWKHRAETAEAQARERAISEGMAIDANDTWRDMVKEMRAERDAARAACDRLRATLESYAVHVDEMSWHGEALVCKLCGGHGTREGAKRGVGDKPVAHAETCMLALTAHAPEPEGKL